MPARRRTGKRSSKRRADTFVAAQAADAAAEIRPTPFLGNMPVIGAPAQVTPGFKGGPKSASKYSANMAARREADLGRIRNYYAEVAAYYSHIAATLSSK